VMTQIPFRSSSCSLPSSTFASNILKSNNNPLHITTTDTLNAFSHNSRLSRQLCCFYPSKRDLQFIRHCIMFTPKTCPIAKLSHSSHNQVLAKPRQTSKPHMAHHSFNHEIVLAVYSHQAIVHSILSTIASFPHETFSSFIAASLLRFQLNEFEFFFIFQLMFREAGIRFGNFARVERARRCLSEGRPRTTHTGACLRALTPLIRDFHRLHKYIQFQFFLCKFFVARRQKSSRRVNALHPLFHRFREKSKFSFRIPLLHLAPFDAENACRK
jgi:hypothetical protein